MMLRLALVGIVAALGVTLPDQSACEQWFASAQNWANATLADWDTWTPHARDNDCRPYARGKTDCPQCRLARSKPAANPRTPVRTAEHRAVATVGQEVLISAKPAVEQPPRPSSPTENRQSVGFEPIVVQEDPFSQVGFELNRMADGIEVPAASSTPPPSAPAPPTAVVASPPRWEPVAASDDLDLSVLGALCGVAGETWADAAFMQVAAQPPRDMEQRDDAFVCDGFGDDVEALAREVASSEPKPDFTTDVTGWDFVALFATDLACCPGTDCALEDDIEAAPTLPPVASLPDLPREVFGPGGAEPTRPEPPRVAPAPPQVVMSVDLPREETPSSPHQNVGRASAEPRLGHAVELTRDAWYAWMNVLTGPALVHVTSRSVGDQLSGFDR